MKKIIILSLVTFTSLAYTTPDIEEIVTHHLAQEALQTKAPGSAIEMVAHDKIHTHAMEYFKTIVSGKGKNFSALPKAIQKRATQTINDIASTVTRKLTAEKSEGLNKISLESMINAALQHIIANLAHIVEKAAIKQRVTKSIHTLFESHQLNEAMVPEELKKEYEARKEIILKKLATLMQIGQQDYVLDKEIQDQVSRSLNAFMMRTQYVLTGKWAKNYVAGIKNKGRGKTPSSSIPVSDATKKQYESLRFIDKLKARRI